MRIRIRGGGLIILTTKKSLHIKHKPPMKPRTHQKVCGGGGWWWVVVVESDFSVKL